MFSYIDFESFDVYFGKERVFLDRGLSVLSTLAIEIFS